MKKNNKIFEKYIKKFRTEAVKKILFDSIKKPPKGFYHDRNVNV